MKVEIMTQDSNDFSSREHENCFAIHFQLHPKKVIIRVWLVSLCTILLFHEQKQ